MVHLTLLTLIRAAFLICLGINLLTGNRICGLIAGVSGILLGALVLLGEF